MNINHICNTTTATAATAFSMIPEKRKSNGVDSTSSNIVNSNPSMKELMAATTKRRRVMMGLTAKPQTLESPSSPTPRRVSCNNEDVPNYADLYGDDPSCPQTPVPTMGSRTTTTTAENDNDVVHRPCQGPRYMRRCSITKFSLDQAARVAVHELEQEEDDPTCCTTPPPSHHDSTTTLRRMMRQTRPSLPRRRMIRAGVPHNNNRSGLNYKDIVPILHQAMEDIDANCY